MEGVTPYPAWEGELSPRGRLPTVAANEVRLAMRNTWSLVAIGLGIAWGLASVIEFYQVREGGAAGHDTAGFFSMIDQLLWFGLAVAATVGGPAIMQDARSGALELYMSRSVTTWEYLGGKVAAVLLLSFAVVAIPATVYWGSSYIFYDDQPAKWGSFVLRALLYAFMWALMVSGLALGLSAIARSVSGATLLLFGGFAVLAFVVDPPGIFEGMAALPELTANTDWAVLSPFAAFEQQKDWLFDTKATHSFPYWWGLLVWGGLTLLGWILLALRHPRVRGEERGEI